MAKLVLDASTAILLAKVDLLRLVTERTECWMGEIAAREALAKKTDDAVAVARLIEEGRIQTDTSGTRANELMRDFRLHAGEAEAILLASEDSAVCGTDDGRAIRCCKVLGIRFTTALALLVAFAEAGDLDQERANELLDKLQNFGRYKARIVDDAASRIRGSGKQEDDT